EARALDRRFIRKLEPLGTFARGSLGPLAALAATISVAVAVSVTAAATVSVTVTISVAVASRLALARRLGSRAPAGTPRRCRLFVDAFALAAEERLQQTADDSLG